MLQKEAGFRLLIVFNYSVIRADFKSLSVMTLFFFCPLHTLYVVYKQAQLTDAPTTLYELKHDYLT